ARGPHLLVLPLVINGEVDFPPLDRSRQNHVADARVLAELAGVAFGEGDDVVEVRSLYPQLPVIPDVTHDSGFQLRVGPERLQARLILESLADVLDGQPGRHVSPCKRQCVAGCRTDLELRLPLQGRAVDA